jgi:hypothetical protein
MKTKYISLTTAIGLWEEYKIDYVRKLIKNPSFSTMDNDTIFSFAKDSIKQTADLVYHIKMGEINLYGKQKEDTEIMKISDGVLSLITYEDFHPFDFDRYVICNNYDYKESYNPSVNYDVLKYVTGTNHYTDLSIEYKELNNYIKVLFAD